MAIAPVQEFAMLAWSIRSVLKDDQTTFGGSQRAAALT